jgi:hypothetical protein
VAQRLARMVWDHEVGGSNPLTPTMIKYLPVCNGPENFDVGMQVDATQQWLESKSVEE